MTLPCTSRAAASSRAPRAGSRSRAFVRRSALLVLPLLLGAGIGACDALDNSSSLPGPTASPTILVVVDVPHGPMSAPAPTSSTLAPESGSDAERAPQASPVPLAESTEADAQGEAVEAVEDPSPDPSPTASSTATPSPTASPTAPASAGIVRYETCEQVESAGVAPLHRGDPGYRTELDPDGDGIACNE